MTDTMSPMSFLDKETADHGLTSFQRGIIPDTNADGIIGDDVLLAYEFRFRGGDFIGESKRLIADLVRGIQAMQRANPKPIAIWSRKRQNEDQLECPNSCCPFGLGHEGLGGIHFHDIEQYELGD